MFESKMLRRTFGHKMGEVAGGREILHCEELHNLFSSPNIIMLILSKGGRGMWGIQYTRGNKKFYVLTTLVGKSGGKRSLEIPNRKSEDNDETSLLYKETWQKCGLDLCDPRQDPSLMSTEMKFRIS
jgi:hypothetical protein